MEGRQFQEPGEAERNSNSIRWTPVQVRDGCTITDSHDHEKIKTAILIGFKVGLQDENFKMLNHGANKLTELLTEAKAVDDKLQLFRAVAPVEIHSVYSNVERKASELDEGFWGNFSSNRKTNVKCSFCKNKGQLQSS